jgi:hypothetical protein
MLDGLWLTYVCYGITQMVTSIARNWDKPCKRERRKPRSRGSCSCYYAKVGRRRRQYKQGNLKPNRIGRKRVNHLTKAQIIKPPRYLPTISIGKDDFPELWGEGTLQIKSRPHGLAQAPCDGKHFNRLVDCCFQASRGGAPTIRYDSDSFQIAIDNCATSCFTNDMNDFVGSPEQVATKVVGIGQAVSTHIGTVRWLIVDDNGSRHELLIPGTRFQASLPFRLLCPQHVAQVYNDPKTTCLTLMDKVVLVWGQGKWKRTLPLHKSSNVGLMWSAPSNNQFFAFASNFTESHIIPDDEEEEDVTVGNRVSDSDMEEQVQEPRWLTQSSQTDDEPGMSESQREQPVQIEFMDEIEREPLQEPPDVTSKQAALRKAYCRLNPSNGQTWASAEVLGQSRTTHVRKLRIWKSHKATLEDEGGTRQDNVISTNNNERRLRLSGSTGVPNSRVHCANQRNLNHKEVQGGNNIC